MTPSLDRRCLRMRAWLPVAAVTVSTSVVFASLVSVTSASAQVLGYADPQSSLSQSSLLSNGGIATAPDERGLEDDSAVLSPRLQRQVVEYATREAPGTVIIDTPNTVLYYVLGSNRAIRYGVGVGREGFTWSGTETISRKAEWPDWHPPADMIARQPYLPRFMAGGPGNPLGARAIYLGSSMYRIHGTNDPSTIGKFVSSGCIRMTNADVEDLFRRVGIGTRVVVLPKSAGRIEARRGNPVQSVAQPATPRRPTTYLPAPL